MGRRMHFVSCNLNVCIFYSTLILPRAGVVGTVFGLGTAVLAEVDNEEAAFAIMSAGSVTGLLIGSSATKNYDRAFHDHNERFGFFGSPYWQTCFEPRGTKSVRMLKMPLLSVNF